MGVARRLYLIGMIRVMIREGMMHRGFIVRAPCVRDRLWACVGVAPYAMPYKTESSDSA